MPTLNFYVTFEDINHIVETNSTISLLCFLKCILNLLILSSTEDAPLFIKKLFEICTTSSSHLIYFICYTNFFIFKLISIYKIIATLYFLYFLQL